MFKDRKKIKPFSIDIDLFGSMPDGVPLNKMSGRDRLIHPEYNSYWEECPFDNK